MASSNKGMFTISLTYKFTTVRRHASWEWDIGQRVASRALELGHLKTSRTLELGRSKTAAARLNETALLLDYYLSDRQHFHPA